MDLSRNEDLRELAAALRILRGVLDDHDTAWVVIGATARDLILRHGHGIQTWRATNDVDLAIAVDSWTAYQAISDDLVGAGALAGPQPHHFKIGQYELDLIPFGDIAISDEIVWPSTGQWMSALGLEEACENFIEVRLPEDLLIHVTAVPALAILKIIAWEDRRYLRRLADATDLRLMIETYGEWNEERLFGSEIELMETYSHELDIAAAALLGREMGRIAKQSTRKTLVTILTREVASDGLAREMGGDADRNLLWLEVILDEMRSKSYGND